MIFLKQIYILYIDKKNIIKNKKLTKIEFFVFIKKTKYPNKYYLIIFKSINEEFQDIYLTFKLIIKICKKFKKYYFLPYLKVELLSLE